MAFNQKAFEQQSQRFQNLRAVLAEAGNIKRIATALKLDPRTDEDKQETLRWMMTVLAEVEKTLGDDKKDLTSCSPESYVQAMIDAATIGVPIDGRRLADLVPRGGRVNYQINTAGFVYLVGLHYEGANFKAGIVYQGDTFSVSTKDGFDHFEHVPADPFQQDATKMRGIYVALSYAKEGRQFQQVERLTKADIEKIKSKAQQNYIWNEWFFERATTAAVKRIAKRQFQTIMGLQQAIAYDNAQNYDMNAPALPAPSAGTIVDNLNAALKPQAEQPKALTHDQTPTMPADVTAPKGDPVPVEAASDDLPFDAPMTFKACPECGGIGEHPRPDQDPETCRTCEGSGEVPA